MVFLRDSLVGNGPNIDDMPSDGEIVIFDEELSEETRYLSQLEKKQHVSIEIEETVTKNINRDRYFCCVSSFRGMATVYIKESQERLVFLQLKEAYRTSPTLRIESTQIIVYYF